MGEVKPESVPDQVQEAKDEVEVLTPKDERDTAIEDANVENTEASEA